jgi:hypothetical protein
MAQRKFFIRNGSHDLIQNVFSGKIFLGGGGVELALTW